MAQADRALPNSLPKCLLSSPLAQSPARGHARLTPATARDGPRQDLSAQNPQGQLERRQ